MRSGLPCGVSFESRAAAVVPVLRATGMRDFRVPHVERGNNGHYRAVTMSVITQHAPEEARQTSGFTGGIATLAEGKLYALQNPYKLDGRVSSYPASARGWSVANCYLLTQPDAAMLIDTGFGKDEQLIISQIEFSRRPGSRCRCSRCGSTSSCRSTTSRRSPGTSTSRPATPAIPTRRCLELDRSCPIVRSGPKAQGTKHRAHPPRPSLSVPRAI